MSDFKRLTGRPLLETGKRNKKIDVRFNEEEFKVIEELEKTLGLNKTEIIRRKTFDNHYSIIINAKEAINSLDAIGEELGRSGNNINQLAKYANTLNKLGMQTEVITSRFNILFEKHIDAQIQVEKALRKIIRLMGR